MVQSACFRLPDDLREHLLENFHINRVDVSPEIEHKGYPHTLILHKNNHTYESRSEEYTSDLEQMRSLVQIPPKRNTKCTAANKMAAQNCCVMKVLTVRAPNLKDGILAIII